MLAQSRRDWIPDDVEDRADEMRLGSEFAAVEAVLEEMADAVVASIRSPSMISVDLLKTAGNAAFRRPQDDVVVVRHQTPREDLPLVLRRCCAQFLAPASAVRAVERDQPTVVTARRHVVDGVRIEDAELASHETDRRPITVTRSSRLCNGV